MSKQRSFWDLDEHLGRISAEGDPLETLAAAVDFERFRPILEKAGRPRGRKGARPALDAVLKFKMLVLQSLHGLSLAATETMVRDRPGWLRFCGLELNETIPDANTLWDFREALTEAGALDDLFEELNRMISAAGGSPYFLVRAAAPRRSLQSKKSAHRLFSMQHLTASMAFAPAFDQRHPARLKRLPTICLQALSTMPDPTGNPRCR